MIQENQAEQKIEISSEVTRDFKVFIPSSGKIVSWDEFVDLLSQKRRLQVHMHQTRYLFDIQEVKRRQELCLRKLLDLKDIPYD